MTRGGVALAGLVVLAVIGNAALSAFRAGRSNRSEGVQVFASSSPRTVQQQGEAVADSAPEQPATSGGMALQTITVATVAPASASPVKGLATPGVAPGAPPQRMTLEVPVGSTHLPDSMYVERGADSAVVHFDTEMGRTRRRDKFEATVRATLPALYGARIRSMLDAIPDGGITGDRDLVRDVATSGVRLPIATGGTLELWPVTRPGRDGPLVVGYRVRVTP